MLTPSHNEPAPALQTSQLSLGLKWGYSTGFVASAAWGVLGGVALFFYNQVVGVPAHLVSLALGIIVFIDALWDPLIGHWSDRLRSNLGRRHPFLYVAMLLVPISLMIRWHPPTDWSDTALFYFILASGLLMSLSTSLFDVPAAALAPELAPDYHDRTVLMSFRFLFATIGSALTSILIYGVFLRPTPQQPVGQLNPDGYGPLAVAVMLLAVVAMAIMTLSTRRKAATLYHAPIVTSSLSHQLRDVIVTLSNRNFAVAAAAAALVGIGGGVAAGLQLYVGTYFWELTSSEILILTLSTMAGAPFAIFIAPFLGRRFGKRISCIGALLVGSVFTNAPMLFRLLGAFPENGSPILIPLLFWYFFYRRDVRHMRRHLGVVDGDGCGGRLPSQDRSAF